MKDLAPLLVLLVLAGLALTVLCGVVVRMMNPDRRVRRGLKTVLKVDPHALIVAPGRGKGAGFNFTTNDMAVAWDAGAWCLIYRMDEMMGAEAIVDGQVAARVHRGEQRRALEILDGAKELVRLRLIFDDPAHPDFDLDLWRPADKEVKGAFTPAEALEEANRWIARVDALLRRPTARRPSAPPPEPAPSPAPAPMATPAVANDPEPEADFEIAPRTMTPLRAEDLPWDDEDEDNGAA